MIFKYSEFIIKLIKIKTFSPKKAPQKVNFTNYDNTLFIIYVVLTELFLDNNI